MNKQLSLKIMATAIAALFLLGGCSMKTYYQVYQTKPVNSDAVQVKDDGLVHEDNYCIVTYNFFALEGNPGFWIYNKSDSVMYVDLTESFFTVGGVSHDYFRDRQWTDTRSRTTSYLYSLDKKARRHHRHKRRNRVDELMTVVGVTSSSGNSMTSVSSTSTNERAVVIIPPHGSKYISEYHITDYVLKVCGMKEKPSKGKPSGASFSRENSPIVFSNYISYTILGKSHKMRVYDEFYVSEVLNVNNKAMFDEVRPKDECGKNTKGDKVKVMRYSTADRYYNTYRR